MPKEPPPLVRVPYPQQFSLTPGMLLGARYEIQKLLGEGGTGAV
jgi:hypothetical protein